MRSRGVFLDTNVVVYAIDPEAPEKRQKAIELIEALGGSAVISTQVLQECYVTAKTKLRASSAYAQQYLARLCEFQVVPSSKELVLAAADIHDRYGIHLYDALIIAAAVESKCEKVFSEDMQHRQVIMGVRIENPFL